MPHPVTGAWTRWDWICHFVDMHKHSGDLSPEEMMKYSEAFVKVMVDHGELHKHFHTGHEHENHGPTKPGRTK